MHFIKAETDRPCLNLGGIEAFAVGNGVIWGALVALNGLVCISMNTWKVQFVARFPEEDEDGIRLYGGAVYYQEKLIFCPMRAKNIVVYDITRNSFCSIPLDMGIAKNSKMYKENYKTEDIVLYDDYAYIIGCSYPAIIRISMQDMSVKYITQPYKELDKRIKDYSSGYFACVTRQNNYLYAGCCLSGDILKFSLEDETYEIIRTDFSGINAVMENDDGFLLTSLADSKGYTKKKEDNCYKDIEGLENVLLAKVIPYMDGAYLFGFQRDRINEKLFRYDFATRELEIMTGFEEGFYNAVKFGNKIFAVFCMSAKIIEMDIEEKMIEEHILTYSGAILRWMREGIETIVMEDKGSDLKDYLDWVVWMYEI